MRDQMSNHTAVAKAFVMAACTLAIALLTIGMGVNATWAGSEQPSGLKYTPILFGGVFPPVPSAGHPLRSITMPRTASRLTGSARSGAFASGMLHSVHLSLQSPPAMSSPSLPDLSQPHSFARPPRCTTSHYRQCHRLAAVSQDCDEYDAKELALKSSAGFCAAAFGFVGSLSALIETVAGCEAAIPNTAKATCLAITKCVVDYNSAVNSLQAQYDSACYED
jgi:hypothetical protein